jgi:predicted component of type VI protein secretion system
MAELIIQSGKLQGKRLVVPDREVVIGRDEDCHVRLMSSLVSRKHCALRGSPEGLWVRDLASQNGTFVNDVPVTEPVLLKPGDILQVGATLFQVPTHRPATASTPGGKGKEAISDAEIASWLSEAGEETPVRPSDTTVIKNAPPLTAQTDVSSAKAAAPASTPLPPTAAGETPRRPPRTIKEQAAEIIRRHWASVRGEEPKGS